MIAILHAPDFRSVDQHRVDQPHGYLMLWYTGKRLLQMIPVFFGATFLIYFMVFSLSGDPIAALYGERPPTTAVLAQIRAEYNLDKPFIAQYLLYIRNFFQGDLGTTYSDRSVADVMASAFPITARLAMLALAFEAFFGIPVGLIAGLRKGKLFDASALVVSLLLISVPTVVIGFVLQFVCSSAGHAPRSAGRHRSTNLFCQRWC
jgi:oligopeptide transport system permease protein